MRIVIEVPPDDVITLNARGVSFERRPIKREYPMIVEAVRGTEPLSVFAGRLLFAVSFVARKRDEYPDAPGRYFMKKPYAVAMKLVRDAFAHVDPQDVTPTAIVSFDNQKRVLGVISEFWSDLSLYGVPIEKDFSNVSFDNVRRTLLELMNKKFERRLNDVQIELSLTWLKMRYWEYGEPSTISFVRPEGAPYGVLIYQHKRSILAKTSMGYDGIRELLRGDSGPIFVSEPNWPYQIFRQGNVSYELYYVPLLNSVVYHKKIQTETGEVLDGGILVEYVGNKIKKRIRDFVLIKSRFIRELFVRKTLLETYNTLIASS